MASIQQEIRAGAYLVVIADILQRARDEGIEIAPVVVGAYEMALDDDLERAWISLRLECGRRKVAHDDGGGEHP